MTGLLVAAALNVTQVYTVLQKLYKIIQVVLSLCLALFFNFVIKHKIKYQIQLLRNVSMKEVTPSFSILIECFKVDGLVKPEVDLLRDKMGTSTLLTLKF